MPANIRTVAFVLTDSKFDINMVRPVKKSRPNCGDLTDLSRLFETLDILSRLLNSLVGVGSTGQSASANCKKAFDTKMPTDQHVFNQLSKK